MLSAYNSERTAVGQSLVALGRQIGHMQVESTPDFGSMRRSDFNDWITACYRADDHFEYGKSIDTR